MKNLTLFRHAKTEHDSPTGRDFDRRLTDRGERDAARMGEEIRRLGIEYDAILSSPAMRAAQTAELAGLAPRLDERIYNASVGQLLAVVQETTADRLLLIGHNPGLEQLGTMLLGTTLDMPTGAVAGIELPMDDWGEAATGRGRLAIYRAPKMLP